MRRSAAVRFLRWPAAFAASAGVLVLLTWTVDGPGPWTWLATAHAPPPRPIVAVAALFIGAAWAMIIGVAILQNLLATGFGPLAVARTLLRQAMRTPSTLVSVLLLFGTLAILPAVMSEDSPLRYRIQSYLAFSHAGITFLLSLATMLMAAQSVSGDFDGGQAGDIFVKPVHRGGYLLGKWLGAVLLNALLVAICGVAICIVSTRWLARMEPMDDHDAFAVGEQVLTARHAVLPDTPPELEAMARQRLDELQRHSPGWIRERGGPDVVLKELQDQAQIVWRSIGPRQQRSFVFRGLNAARNAQSIQLRFKLEMPSRPASGTVRLGLIANGRPAPMQTAVGVVQVSALPASFVDESGILEIVFANVDPLDPEAEPAGSISFPPGDGLQVLYKAGGFPPNLLRAMLVLWVKLAFLAALAVVAPTFLSFPVACLLCLAVWVVSAGSGEIAGMMAIPGPDSAGFAYSSILLPAVAAITGQLAQFGRPDTSSLLTDGRLIAWSEVIRHGLAVGICWTAACGLIGWLIFRRRQIAEMQT